MPITHSKVSAVPDNVAAPGLVQPSEWNAAHVIGALGTPSADGIVFPATQVNAAGANTLDDYEEGSWTPALVFDPTPGNHSVTYANRSGVYTKIGRLVVAHFYMETPTWTHTTASGALTLTGLPYAAGLGNATYGAGGSVTLTCTLTGMTTIRMLVWGASGTTARFHYMQSGTTNYLQHTHVPTASNPSPMGSVIYYTA